MNLGRVHAGYVNQKIGSYTASQRNYSSKSPANSAGKIMFGRFNGRKTADKVIEETRKQTEGKSILQLGEMLKKLLENRHDPKTDLTGYWAGVSKAEELTIEKAMRELSPST